ncbi:GAF domain-containing protein [Actinophytocola xanthii]|uniref:Uncharacterized protein n=1 Tax=Actinophytocola xanthii TaxID=1912961 RepID=A0A1Q8BY83_9PSEU|nr:GAF domain-containing protein [Actinophytocola xanthii]OLF07080.1 hypothetical protein BU204_35810 [Actinophytocola xanthii]
MGDWLLIETFGGNRGEPTVMAVGSQPKKLVALGKLLARGGHIVPDIRMLLERVQLEKTSIRSTTSNGRRQVIVHPLQTYGGDVHGAFVWVGQLDETPPPRERAGAWHVNITRHTSSRSDDLLDLYGHPPESRRYVVDLAQLFAYGQLETNSDEGRALAMLLKSEAGQTHVATWVVTRVDDGSRRAAHFACRCVEVPTEDGGVEVVARGITHDIGPAERVAFAPPAKPVLLAQQVLIAEKTDDRWRAIVNLRTMRLLRWVDDPVPGIAWELGSPHPPGIHRRDLKTAASMREALTRSGRAKSELRFRAVDGSWIRLDVTANLMVLDDTTAALVTLEWPHRPSSLY